MANARALQNCYHKPRTLTEENIRHFKRNGLTCAGCGKEIRLGELVLSVRHGGSGGKHTTHLHKHCYDSRYFDPKKREAST